MVDESQNIRKKEAFEAFICTLKGGAIGHWQNVAAAIGVTNDTITAWKKLPEAQEAIKNSIRLALEGMEKAGTNDWRMWESKLKILGIGHTDKKVIELSGQVSGTPIIPIMRGLSMGIIVDDDGKRYKEII